MQVPKSSSTMMRLLCLEGNEQLVSESLNRTQRNDWNQQSDLWFPNLIGRTVDVHMLSPPCSNKTSVTVSERSCFWLNVNKGTMSHLMPWNIYQDHNLFLSSTKCCELLKCNHKKPKTCSSYYYLLLGKQMKDFLSECFADTCSVNILRLCRCVH